VPQGATSLLDSLLAAATAAADGWSTRAEWIDELLRVRAHASCGVRSMYYEKLSQACHRNLHECAPDAVLRRAQERGPRGSQARAGAGGGSSSVLLLAFGGASYTQLQFVNAGGGDAAGGAGAAGGAVGFQRAR
jgi:hypothetical protein